MNAHDILGRTRRLGKDIATGSGGDTLLVPDDLPPDLLRAIAENKQPLIAILSGRGDLFSQPHDPDTAEIAALRQRLDNGAAHLWHREETGDIEASDYAAQVAGFVAIQDRYEAACQAGWRET